MDEIVNKHVVYHKQQIYFLMLLRKLAWWSMELFDVFGRRTSSRSTLKHASYVSGNDQFPVFVATAGTSKVL